jgi:hypothetical protein
LSFLLDTLGSYRHHHCHNTTANTQQRTEDREAASSLLNALTDSRSSNQHHPAAAACMSHPSLPPTPPLPSAGPPHAPQRSSALHCTAALSTCGLTVVQTRAVLAPLVVCTCSTNTHSTQYTVHREIQAHITQ